MPTYQDLLTSRSAILEHLRGLKAETAQFEAALRAQQDAIRDHRAKIQAAQGEYTALLGQLAQEKASAPRRSVGRPRKGPNFTPEQEAAWRQHGDDNREFGHLLPGHFTPGSPFRLDDQGRLDLRSFGRLLGPLEDREALRAAMVSALGE